VCMCVCVSVCEAVVYLLVPSGANLACLHVMLAFLSRRQVAVICCLDCHLLPSGAEPTSVGRCRRWRRRNGCERSAQVRLLL